MFPITDFICFAYQCFDCRFRHDVFSSSQTCPLFSAAVIVCDPQGHRGDLGRPPDAPLDRLASDFALLLHFPNWDITLLIVDCLISCQILCQLFYKSALLTISVYGVYLSANLIDAVKPEGLSTHALGVFFGLLNIVVSGLRLTFRVTLQASSWLHVVDSAIS